MSSQSSPTKPFLPFQRHSHQSSDPTSFQPKSVTDASWATKKSVPRQTGPLIDFNAHPDSYVSPAVQVDRLERSQRARHLATTYNGIVTTVRWGRCIQLAVRILEFGTAIGLLVCIICLTNVKSPSSWLIRIPVGVSVLTSAYGIYHLMSSTRKGRTPGSTASYHFFAFIIDTGLLAFAIFTVIISRSNLGKRANDDTRWRSLIQPGVSTNNFETVSLDADNNLIKATSGLAIAAAAEHFLGAILSMILLLVYRRVSAIPPDLNPLNTDNSHLTRRKRKFGFFGSRATDELLPYHNRNTSDSTYGDYPESKNDKNASPRDSYLASDHRLSNPPVAMTVHKTANNRHSQTLTGLDGNRRGVRPVSFLQTRSSVAFSGHTPQTVQHLTSQYQHQQRMSAVAPGSVSGTPPIRHIRTNTDGSIHSLGSESVYLQNRAALMVHNPDSYTPSLLSHSRVHSHTDIPSRIPSNEQSHSLSSSSTAAITNHHFQPSHRASNSIPAPNPSGLGIAAPHPQHGRTPSIESTSSSSNPKRYRGSRPVSMTSVQDAENATPSPVLLGRSVPPSSFVARVAR